MDYASYKIIRVARDWDFFHQIGRDIYFDLIDHDRVRTFHIQRQTPFRTFKEEIAGEFGIPVEFQRFWRWARRQNDTYRPVKPLTHEEESKPVGELKEMSDKKSIKLNLFLEVELGPHHCPVAPPVKSNDDILLFFKLYDPEKEELRYVGRLFVKSYAKLSDILGKVNELAGFGPDEEVYLYEEIRIKPAVMCELIDRTVSFRANQIEDGDIICFQKTLVQNGESFRYPTVPSFLEHIRGHQEMEAQNHPLKRVTMKISNFSGLTSGKYDSDVFTVDGFKWKIVIYPKGNNTNYFSIYLNVADHASLPVGWSRTVNFRLTVLNQNCWDFSITKGMSRTFMELEHELGFASFMPLTELHEQTRGFLVQDTLVIEADIAVLKDVVIPPTAAPNAVPRPSAPPLDAYSARQMDRLVSYCNGLDEFIDAAETSASRGPSSGAQQSVPMRPSSKEVESAKQSLKECLSDLFKLNMKERLASALSTLSVAETGLSCEQRKSVLEFWVHFDDFISDYLTFEQDNSEFELQKLQSDLLFSAIKKNRGTHLFYKELSEKLAREEEELKKKLEETRCRNARLISDWEALIAESEETKSKYVSQKAKQAEAEERKRIAEERMSRTATAWSSLKAHFL